MARSSHHLIGLEEQRRGEREPEGLSRLEVDDEPDLDRRLHGQIGHLRSIRNIRERKAKNIYRLGLLCTRQQGGTRCVIVIDIQANGVLKNEQS